jgi:hypothetical protein
MPKAKASKLGSAKAKSKKKKEQAKVAQDEPVRSIGGIEDIGDSNEASEEESHLETKTKASKAASSNKKEEDHAAVRFDENDQRGFNVKLEREDEV